MEDEISICFQYFLCDIIIHAWYYYGFAYILSQDMDEASYPISSRRCYYLSMAQTQCWLSQSMLQIEPPRVSESINKSNLTPCDRSLGNKWTIWPDVSSFHHGWRLSDRIWIGLYHTITSNIALGNHIQPTIERIMNRSHSQNLCLIIQSNYSKNYIRMRITITIQRLIYTL